MAVLAVAAAAFVLAGGDPRRGEVVSEARPAGAAVAAALRRHDVVLIGEIHGWSAEHRLLRRLLERAAVEGGAADVAVEFGNARYQDLVDRYVGGASVPLDAVARAWRQTTQGGAWNAPEYAAFYAAVREHNARHPRRRLRLLLGDPPIPVDAPRGELDHWILQRDVHFAHVVLHESVDRGRRVLVVAGVGHVRRRPDDAPTLTNLLEGASCATDPRSVAAGIDWCDDLRGRRGRARTYVVLPAEAGTDSAAGAPAGHVVGARAAAAADALLVVGR